MNKIGHEILRVVEAAKNREKYAWKESDTFRDSLERGFFFMVYDLTEGFEYLKVYRRQFDVDNMEIELSPKIYYEFTEENYEEILGFEL